MRILWKLLEEESQEGVDVFTRGNSVADGASAVRIARIDWLVKEDDRRIRVPRERIVDYVQILIDRCGAKFEEETSQGTASRSPIEPKDDWIILRIISRLKEPWHRW